MGRREVHVESVRDMLWYFLWVGFGTHERTVVIINEYQALVLEMFDVVQYVDYELGGDLDAEQYTIIMNGSAQVDGGVTQPVIDNLAIHEIVRYTVGLQTNSAHVLGQMMDNGLVHDGEEFLAVLFGLLEARSGLGSGDLMSVKYELVNYAANNTEKLRHFAAEFYTSHFYLFGDAKFRLLRLAFGVTGANEMQCVFLRHILSGERPFSCFGAKLAAVRYLEKYNPDICRLLEGVGPHGLWQIAENYVVMCAWRERNQKIFSYLSDNLVRNIMYHMYWQADGATALQLSHIAQEPFEKALCGDAQDYSTGSLVELLASCGATKDRVVQAIKSIICIGNVQHRDELVCVLRWVDDSVDKNTMQQFLRRAQQLRIVQDDMYDETYIVSTQSRILPQVAHKLVQENVRDALIEVLRHIFVEEFKIRYEAPYMRYIMTVNALPDLSQQINNENYGMVLGSREYLDILCYVRNVFTKNVLSAQLHQIYAMQAQSSNIITPDRQINMLFDPGFSLEAHLPGPATETIWLFKNELANCLFTALLAELIVFFSQADSDDRLLTGIERLLNEDLAIIQENNMQLNDFVQRRYGTMKLSRVFTQQVVQYVENDNYWRLVHQTCRQCRDNEQQRAVLLGLGGKIDNFGVVLPKLSRYINYLFSHGARIGDSHLQYDLRSPLVTLLDQWSEHKGLFPKFVLFLRDMGLIRANAGSCNDFVTCDEIKKLYTHKVGDNVVKNVRTSLGEGRYTTNELAFCAGCLQLYPQAICRVFSLLDGTIETRLVGVQLSCICQLLPRNKAKLLNFLINPQQFNYFTVKESLLNTQVQPVVDVFDAEGNQIKDVLNNTALYMLLIDEGSMFFTITADYGLLKEYQVAGVAQQVGFAYHYDCLIKDYVLTQAINFTLRRLQVQHFRFFIIFYCSLIFISSYCFGRYKNHCEYCNIISSYQVLHIDRFCYLTSQINNCMNLLQNYKGFTEAGAVNYYNIMLQEFVYKKCGGQARLTPEQLEELIVMVDYDSVQAAFLKTRQSLTEVINNSHKRVSVTGVAQQNDTPACIDVERTLDQQCEAIYGNELASHVLDMQKQAIRMRLRQRVADNDKHLTAITLFEQPIPQSIDYQLVMAQKLGVLAQQSARRADFIRMYAASLESIARMVASAVQLSQYITRQYDGRLYTFQYEICQVGGEIVCGFIEAYGLGRDRLLSIQNACSEQEFPDISTGITLGQLVMSQCDSRDGQSSMGILCEVLHSYTRMVALWRGDRETEPLDAETLAWAFGSGFTDLVLRTDNLSAVEAALDRYLRPVAYEVPKLRLRPFKLRPARSYETFRACNALFLSVFPDFNISQAEFNDLAHRVICADVQRFSQPISGENGIIDAILRHHVDQHRYPTVGGLMIAVFGYDDADIADSLRSMALRELCAAWCLSIDG